MRRIHKVGALIMQLLLPVLIFAGEVKNEDTTVFITGASSGIGLFTAEKFAKEGYKVIATARAPEKSPRLLALAEEHQNLFVERLDVTDSEEKIETLVRSVGNVDILINNAGLGIVGATESISIEQVQKIIETNVIGVVKVTNAMLPVMRAKNSGLIITISSIVGPLPSMQQCFYSGSKAMIEHYTSQLKNDLKDAGYNITVANIHPGPVVTNFETAAVTGERFSKEENPYPHMDEYLHNWRLLMRDGRPVSETVDTIFNVANTENPLFWNPTEHRVLESFEEVYLDPTGEGFARGPCFKGD